jgi:hypothetical protein
MEKLPGESDDERSRRGTYYAIFKRIEGNKDFFDRVWKLQPRFMAAFGPETEDIFMLLHQSRRDIEVAAGTLGQDEKTYAEGDAQLRELRQQARRDVWSTGTFQPEKDIVSRRLEDFRGRMERICRPILDRQYARMQETEKLLEDTAAVSKLIEETRRKAKRAD